MKKIEETDILIECHESCIALQNYAIRIGGVLSCPNCHHSGGIRVLSGSDARLARRVLGPPFDTEGTPNVNK